MGQGGERATGKIYSVQFKSIPCSIRWASYICGINLRRGGRGMGVEWHLHKMPRNDSNRVKHPIWQSVRIMRRYYAWHLCLEQRWYRWNRGVLLHWLVTQSFQISFPSPTTYASQDWTPLTILENQNIILMVKHGKVEFRYERHEYILNRLLQKNKANWQKWWPSC